MIAPSQQLQRYNDIANKLAGAKGGEILSGAMPELSFGVCLEMDRPEYEHLGGGRLRMGFMNVAAGGAGNASVIALLNPSNSNSLIILEWADFFPATGVLVNVAIFAEVTITTNFTQGGTMTSRDSRAFGAAGGNGVGQLWFRNNAAGPGGVSYVLRPGSAQPFPKLIMHPGFAYGFADTTLNEIMSGAFSWRERPAQPEELKRS